MIRRDLAPVIAKAIIENPPKTSGPEETLAWALRTWPMCTYEEADRAVRIAFEIAVADYIVPVD